MGILSDFELGVEEYATLSEDVTLTDNTYKVHISKIMPYISSGTAVSGNPMIFNNNIFLNDSSNKPSCSSVVNTQNFVTLTASQSLDNTNSTDGFAGIKKGTRVVVRTMNDNIRQMNIIGIMN